MKEVGVLRTGERIEERKCHDDVILAITEISGSRILRAPRDAAVVLTRDDPENGRGDLDGSRKIQDDGVEIRISTKIGERLVSRASARHGMLRRRKEGS